MVGIGPEDTQYCLASNCFRGDIIFFSGNAGLIPSDRGMWTGRYHWERDAATPGLQEVDSIGAEDPLEYRGSMFPASKESFHTTPFQLT